MQTLAEKSTSTASGMAITKLTQHIGAEVTAVCSGKNAQLVRDLGAHHVIDYTLHDYASLGDTYDVVFDTVGKSSFRSARGCLRRGGRYLLTVGGPIAYLRDLWSRWFGSRKFVFGMSIEKRGALAVVSDLAACGALRAVIDRRYSLREIAEAHRYVESGRKRGNVVIAVEDL